MGAAFLDSRHGILGSSALCKAAPRVAAVLAGALGLTGTACTSAKSVGIISGLASPCVGAARAGEMHQVTVYARRDGKVAASRRVSPEPGRRGNPYKLMVATWHLYDQRAEVWVERPNNSSERRSNKEGELPSFLQMTSLVLTAAHARCVPDGVANPESRRSVTANNALV